MLLLTARRLRQAGLLVMSLVLAGPVMAIAPFKADYRASYMGMQADGQMVLESLPNQQWRYSLKVRNQLADLGQSTVFDIRDGHFRPLTSHDTTNVVVKRRKVEARYDWSTAQATWSGDIKPERRGPVALRAGDMDALLINLAIARDHAAGKPMSYRMVDEGRIKPMRYTVAGKETLELAGKQVEVTRVSRVDGDKEQVAWISPLYPVPLRLLQREKGQDALDLTIRAVH